MMTFFFPPLLHRCSQASLSQNAAGGGFSHTILKIVNIVLASPPSFIPITPYIKKALQAQPWANCYFATYQHPPYICVLSFQATPTSLKGPPYCKITIFGPVIQEGLLSLSSCSSLGKSFTKRER